MRFGIFYEHQLPRPWAEGGELKLFQDALDQVELGDRLGIDYAWEVEHHFLEEYSPSPPPEVFLAPRTRRSGSRVRTARPSISPPSSGWARSRSPSSTPRRRRTGSRTTTTPSSVSACRSATPSTP